MNKPLTNAENQEHNKQIVDKYNAKPNIIEIRKNNPPREVIRIAPDGKLFWNEREVETDDDFRSAMLDLAESLKQPTDLIRQQQAEIEALKDALGVKVILNEHAQQSIKEVKGLLRKAQEK